MPKILETKTMIKQLLIIAGFLSCSFAYAQNVNIPDANFKAYLIGNSAINTNGDNEIQISEANSFTGMLDCYKRQIKDLKGIESFTKIKQLNCSENELVSLNVSMNTALTTLQCNDNQLQTLSLNANVLLYYVDCTRNLLTSIDVTKNTILTNLICHNNLLVNIDVSKNTALTFLDCYNNQFNNLDLSKNINLVSLYCGGNPLKTLDVTKNVKLKDIGCNDNQLTTLDISKNIALVQLNFSDNELVNLDTSKNLALNILNCTRNLLTSLDLSKNTALSNLACDVNQLNSLDLSKNISLKLFSCSGNKLASLDLSKNILLTLIRCANNQLKSLNLKNTKNTLITFQEFMENPDLNCIQVDDAAYSTTKWIKKDAWANYNTNCSYTLGTNSFNKPTLKIYPNPLNNKLNIQTKDQFQKAEIYTINGQLLKTSLLKEIDVSELSKGNYIIKIKTDKGLQIEKMIKE